MSEASTEPKSYVPSEDEILAFIRPLHRSDPTLGLEKVLQRVKEANPTWSIAAKRLKAIRTEHDLRTLMPQSAASASSPEKASTAAPQPNSIPQPPPPPRTVQYWGIDPIGLIIADATPTGDFYVPEPNDGSPMAEEFGLIYTQYIKAGRGPLPNPAPFVKDYEARAFFMLFPYGTGHWQGLDGHPTRLTFDEYAQYRLQVHNSPFKRSVNWLLWALTMVKEEKSRWMLSYALWAGCDQIKARHIGKGLIQLKTNYRVNWEPVRRVGDVLELK